jgi:hypothetical protein
MERLCGTYWYPLYVFVRRKGHGHENACNLTQAFFARFRRLNVLQSSFTDFCPLEIILSKPGVGGVRGAVAGQPGEGGEK